MALWASLQDVHCIGLGMIASSKWLYPALTKSHLESEQQKLSKVMYDIQLNFDNKNLTGTEPYTSLNTHLGIEHVS